MNTPTPDLIIKVRRTQNSAWQATCHQLMAMLPGQISSGEGSSPQEAIASLVILNAKYFGIKAAHYDMQHTLTVAHVNTNSISNTKII